MEYLEAVLGAGITKMNDNSHDVNSPVREIGMEISELQEYWYKNVWDTETFKERNE